MPLQPSRISARVRHGFDRDRSQPGPPIGRRQGRSAGLPAASVHPPGGRVAQGHECDVCQAMPGAHPCGSHLICRSLAQTQLQGSDTPDMGPRFEAKPRLLPAAAIYASAQDGGRPSSRTLTQPDAAYHGAVWTEAANPLCPIAYILRARVKLLRDLGAAPVAVRFVIAPGIGGRNFRLRHKRLWQHRKRLRGR